MSDIQHIHFMLLLNQGYKFNSLEGIMNKKLSLSDFQRIASEAIQRGHFLKKEVRISSKPDYVDRALERAEKILKR